MESMCMLTAQSFYEMEFYKEAYWGKLDQRNIFTKILLYCEEDPFPSEVHHITEKFNIDTSIVRVPILFILRYRMQLCSSHSPGTPPNPFRSIVTWWISI